MTITGKQIAMARILLDLNQQNLAKNLSIARKTIIRIENGQSTGSSPTLEKIQLYFENHGLEFLEGDGVRKNTGEIRTLRGAQGFSLFLDDVYNCALEFGTAEKPFKIYVSNAYHKNWIKWMGEEKWANHVKRMEKIKNMMNIKILLKEGDDFFPAQSYSHYKWFPERLWSDRAFYSYGKNLAFLNFMEDDVEIMILQQAEFTKGYRVLFNIAWNNVAIEPKIKSKS